MGLTLRQLRLRAVWLLVLPFLLFATPTVQTLRIGAALAVVGLAVRAWAAGTIRKDQALTTGGPYAFTRNPLYLGSLVMGGGVTLAGGHWVWPLLFLLFFAVVYGRTMRQETRLLLELFPERYPEYRDAVPALLPRVSAWHPRERDEPSASTGFRWGQYFAHREWEALLGVLAAFALLTARLLLSPG